MKWSPKMKYCDVRTNSLKQYHKECMKNGVQKMHVDFKASDLWDTNSVRRFYVTYWAERSWNVGWRRRAQIKHVAWPMAEWQIGHRKSCFVLSALNWSIPYKIVTYLFVWWGYFPGIISHWLGICFASKENSHKIHFSKRSTRKTN